MHPSHHAYGPATVLDGHGLSVRALADGLVMSFQAGLPVTIVAPDWKRPILTAVVDAVVASSGLAGEWAFQSPGESAATEVLSEVRTSGLVDLLGQVESEQVQPEWTDVSPSSDEDAWLPGDDIGELVEDPYVDDPSLAEHLADLAAPLTAPPADAAEDALAREVDALDGVLTTATDDDLSSEEPAAVDQGDGDLSAVDAPALVPDAPVAPEPPATTGGTGWAVGSLTVDALVVREMRVAEDHPKPAVEDVLPAVGHLDEDRRAIPEYPLTEAAYTFLALQQPTMVSQLTPRPDVSTQEPTVALPDSVTREDLLRDFASLDL